MLPFEAATTTSRISLAGGCTPAFFMPENGRSGHRMAGIVYLGASAAAGK